MILGLVLGDVECFVRAFGGTIGAQTPSFLSFPYVCPEPVLAKCSFLYINGSNIFAFSKPSSNALI